MTQRVARPMKFAAFISIIVSVAVIFAACQGAVGPAGDDGAQGPQGPQGPQGDMGDTRLQPTADTATIPVYITNGADATDAPGEAVMVTVSDEYFGGVGNISLGELETEELTAARIFTASLENGVITFAVRLNAAGDAPFITGTQAYVAQQYTLKVIDDAAADLTLTFDVRRNRAPTSATTEVSDTVGTAAPDTAPSEVPMCPAANECYVDVTFEDLDNSNESPEMLSFEAVSGDDTKFTVMGAPRNAPDTNGDPQPLVARVVIMGVASTWDAGAGAHSPVDVTVTATDPAGASVEGTAAISVDGAPRMKGAAISLPAVTASGILITDLNNFFEDPEGENLIFTATSANGQAGTASTSQGDGDQLDFVKVSAGQSTEITVTATEESANDQPDQAFSQTFTLQVN